MISTAVSEKVPALKDGRGWRSAGIHAALFVVACALIVSRRPDALFHAQFFAEDGHVWFADAYNYGWLHALIRSQDGYYQTFPRLAAALALLAPMAAAPLVMNAIATIVQALPAYLLLSRRLSGWGPVELRALLAFLYLALPNSREMSITTTESQWYLALTACLLILGSVPDRAAWRVFDVVVYTLSGLTGPFCLPLFLLAAIFLKLRRDRWRWAPAVIFLTTGLIQASALLITDAAARTHFGPLGVTWRMFTRIVSGQIYLGALLGSNLLGVMHGMRFLLPVGIGGTVMFACAWFLSGTELRLFLLFAAFVFAGSLFNPSVLARGEYSRWSVMAVSVGVRYWFFPLLAFVWSIGVLAVAASRLGAILSAAALAPLLFLCCFGVRHDWKYPALTDRRFGEYAAQLEQAAPGTQVVFPVYPDGWTVTLVKH